MQLKGKLKKINKMNKKRLEQQALNLPAWVCGALGLKTPGWDFRIGQHQAASRTQPAERLFPLLINPAIYLYQSAYWTAGATHISAADVGEISDSRRQDNIIKH